MKKAVVILILFISSIQLSFAEGDVVISDAWVREVPPGTTVSAGYMTIENKGSEADKLNSISTTAAEVVEIHMSKVDDNGVATMERVKVLKLPAGESVELKPGGMHLMLIGLKESLVGKEGITINLDFEKSETVTIEVPVKSLKDSDEHHHH